MQRRADTAHQPDPNPPSVLSSGHWDVQMLGGLRARSGDLELCHFPTRAIACLLARLALQPHRDHAREELAELLWPALPHAQPSAPAALRSRLRHALSTLRSLLEPPGYSAVPVLVAKHLHVRLNAALVHTDVAQFEALCQAAAGGDAAAAQAARALYRGELLPGYDDDWVRDQRHHLADLYEHLNRRQHHTAPRSDARWAHPAYAGMAAQRVPAAQPSRRLLAYVTPFFGRQTELAQLQPLLRQHRLLHLVGPGGCGKTRHAVQWAMQDRSFDSIHLVPLQECGSPDGVPDQLRAALDLQASSARAIDQVVDRLQGRVALLILDSCEHLLPTADEPATGRQPAVPTLQNILHTLQQRLPQLQLLLTSRRALHAGSPRLTLLPLPVPVPGTGVAQALACASVALFVDRARAVRADFTLHARNVQAVLQLCALLDGLPVLIEIAASRARHFSPRDLCQQLSASLTVLQRTGPVASRAGHHRSAQALLHWSWRHLQVAEQAMLAAVVVFRGGWTLPAAAAVARCSLAACAAALRSLSEHHLVHSELDAQGRARWQLLGVVREQVQAWVGANQAARHREQLREHLLAWAQSLQARHEPFDPVETQNVEQALASALSDGDGASGITLALALQWPWVAVGVPARLLALLESLADAAVLDAGGAEQAAAFHSLRARLLMHSGQAHEAVMAAEKALACAGSHPGARADALQARTSVRWRSQPDGATALPAAQEAWRLASSPTHASTGSDTRSAVQLQARAALLLGSITVMQGQDAAGAQVLFDQAAALFAGVGDRAGELSVLPGRITCLHVQGRHQEAAEVAETGLLQAQALRHVETQLLLLNRLSSSFEALRRYRQVVRVNQQQLLLARQQGLAYHQAIAVWNLCLPLVRLRHAHRALPLMAFVQRWWTGRFGALAADDLASVQDLRERALLQLGAAACARLWAEGEAMTMADGLELALNA